MISTIICLSFAFCILGQNIVFGFECDLEHASVCQEALINFETAQFPFYGGTEEQLDETCKEMSSTFECVTDHISNCKGAENCDKECQDSVETLSQIYNGTGVRALYEKLCDHEGPYRQKYLESYECLEMARDSFSNCKNTTEESREYLREHNFGQHIGPAYCCFFSWHQMCYTNATMDTCGSNATFVVSFALHLVVGHIVENMCGDHLPNCHQPPLPWNDVVTPLTEIPESEPIPSDAGALRTSFFPLSSLILLKWKQSYY